MSNLSEIMNQPVCIPDTIPDDWKWNKLVEVCSPKQWKTISASEMTKSGFPVFGANGFVGFYPEYNHVEKTVAITCRGNTCGTINRVPPKSYITGNSMALNNVSTDMVSEDFLYHALNFRSVSDAISGSAQPQITRDNLNHISFPTAPLPEQQKIAAILSSVDEVIEKTQAQINKLKDLKTGMMQELLSPREGQAANINNPQGESKNSLHHTEFKDSPLGRIPVGWEVSEIAEVANVVDSMHQTPSFSEVGMPMVRVTEIRKGEVLDISSAVFVDQKTFTSFSKNYKPKIGDTLIARVGAYFGATAFIDKDLEFCLGQNTASIRPKNIYPQFLFDFFNSENARLQMGDTVAVGAQPSLSLKAVKEFKIALPPLDEQKKISDTIHSVRQKIFTVGNKLNTIQLLKKALMQDLLTGKVRVKVD